MLAEHKAIAQHGRHGVYSAGHMGDLLQEIIRDPDPFLTPTTHTRVLKTDTTTTISLIHRDDFNWVIKRYNTKNSWHALRRVVQTSRAANCWNMSLRMKEAGISVATPIAFFENRRFGVRKHSYFISEYIDGDVLLRYLTLDQKQSETFIPQISRVFNIFKSAGISHGDMKATNILVHQDGLVLIDLDAAQVLRSKVSKKRAYEKDRERFLKNWQQYPELLSQFSSAIPQ